MPPEPTTVRSPDLARIADAVETIAAAVRRREITAGRPDPAAKSAAERRRITSLYALEAEQARRKAGAAKPAAEAKAPADRPSLPDDVGEALRDALHAQAEIKARHLAGWRCGACYACRGIDADPRCRHEKIVVERDAIRRLHAHAQAINPAALDPMGAHIFGLLVDELGKLAAQAGLK